MPAFGSAWSVEIVGFEVVAFLKLLHLLLLRHLLLHHYNYGDLSSRIDTFISTTLKTSYNPVHGLLNLAILRFVEFLFLADVSDLVFLEILLTEVLVGVLLASWVGLEDVTAAWMMPLSVIVLEGSVGALVREGDHPPILPDSWFQHPV